MPSIIFRILIRKQFGCPTTAYKLHFTCDRRYTQKQRPTLDVISIRKLYNYFRKLFQFKISGVKMSAVTLEIHLNSPFFIIIILINESPVNLL